MCEAWSPERTRRGSSLVKADIDRSRRERDAFERLRRDVAGLDVDTPSVVPSQAEGELDTQATRSATTTQAVRDYYRETLMSLPHYDDVYGDTFAGSIRSEFGAEVRRLLVSDQPLLPSVHHGLVAAVDEERRRRTCWLMELDAKRRSLEQARTDLSEVATTARSGVLGSVSTPAVTPSDHACRTVSEARDRCEVLAVERQAVLQARSDAEEHIPDETVFEHLYGGLDVTYPVLADIAEPTDSLRVKGDRLARASVEESV